MSAADTARQLNVRPKAISKMSATPEFQELMRELTEGAVKAAQKTLESSANEAAARVSELVHSRKPDVALRAAFGVLDRVGLGPTKKLDHTVQPPGTREEAIARLETLLSRLKGSEGT